ncbi:putative transcription factor interactor and regulator CCHC(Zn) family protein [Tanacetum coccineum]
MIVRRQNRHFTATCSRRTRMKLLSYNNDECEQQFKENPQDFEKYLPEHFFNTITDHKMKEPETESDSDEELPFKTEKINKVKSKYKKGESSRKNSKNYEFRMPLYKGVPNKNSSSSGDINILNLDCISDLTERKRILEKWSTEISLILQTNQDDFQTAKSVLTLIEHKTEVNIQRLVKQAQWNEDLHGIDFFDSVIDILYTMFVGINYHGNKDLEIIKEQEQARRNLTRVQLINICSLDEYTCVYEKNIYKIPLSEHLQWIEAYLMKIPIISEQTIQRWKNEGNVISKNSLAFATRLAKEEITKICDTRYKQKKLKSLSKSCCENIVDMENLDIGRIRNDKKKSFYKKKFKKKYKTSWKQKRKRFSPGKYFKPTKDPPEKYCPKGKEKKKCRCWTCNEEGHYSNECPKKNQYPTKVKMCRIALLHGYEPIEDIYEDEKDVFCLKKEEIIVTDNSSSSSDNESSE